VLLRRVLLETAHVQVSARHLNGRDMLVQIAPLNLHGGESGGMVLNFSDISLLKASERKRSELLNFLSHDLRSPLVSMLALIQLAEAKDPPQAVQDLLTRMHGHTENTIEMAEQFLQLARAESNQDYPLQELDLAAVILNAMEQVWAQARARDITLENRLSTDEAWVMGDGSLLERALVNLLNNAIKYSPPGRTVRITLEQQQDLYRCCVIDNGYGITAWALPHLFDRFQRVERPPHQQAGGIGLGLAFVDTVIRRHGGRIEVTSTEGEGSCFCLFLNAV
jgi:signal transduction histidine kinase